MQVFEQQNDPTFWSSAQGRMSSVARYRTLFGPMFHLSHDECIGRAFGLYGQWALDEMAMLKFILDRVPGDIVDLGANVGAHTVALARLYPDRLVHSFEAQADIFRILAANTVVNGIGNCRLNRNLVGAHTRLSRVEVRNPLPTNYGAVSFRVLDEGEAVPGDEVLAQVAVDDVIERDRAVGAVKADLEGMELPAFIGMAATIDRDRPAVYFELNHDSDGTLLFRFFRERGYACFWHISFPFDSENLNGHDRDIFGGATERNVLCVPDGSPLAAELATMLVPVEEALDGQEDRYRILNGELCRALRAEIADSALTEPISREAALWKEKFEAILEDRTRAQEIMEHQAKEIADLRSTTNLAA